MVVSEVVGMVRGVVYLIRHRRNSSVVQWCCISSSPIISDQRRIDALQISISQLFNQYHSAWGTSNTESKQSCAPQIVLECDDVVLDFIDMPLIVLASTVIIVSTELLATPSDKPEGSSGPKAILLDEPQRFEYCEESSTIIVGSSL